MKPLHLTLGAAAAVAAALALTIGAWTPAQAQQPAVKGQTPDNFPYEIRNGKRVPKGKRSVSADGSWKEEIRNGACSTVKERNANGEYREVRKCD